MVGVVIVLALVVLIALFFILSIKQVRQSTARNVERLGKYHRTLNSGIHFIIPFIERIGPTISLKESVADFKPQSVITKDNVTMQIDTVVYYQITDPKLYSYGIDNPQSALENLTATTLRNIVGELELDETLTSRDTVNNKMRIILDEATDAWGIKVNRVELKNILPPREIQEAMEKQMRAERERREAILRAEGEKKSNILVAEGEKEAAILRAEAKRISLETEAEGMAAAIKMIIDSKPDAAYLTLQGYDALKTLANGQATKIIVPSDIQNVAGLFTSLKEVISSPSPGEKTVQKTAQKAIEKPTEKTTEKTAEKTSD